MGDGGFEPPKALPADLQSVPFGHSGNPPYEIGAGGRIRTPDLLITNQLLYQLSYTSMLPAKIILAEVSLFVNKNFHKMAEKYHTFLPISTEEQEGTHDTFTIILGIRLFGGAAGPPDRPAAAGGGRRGGGRPALYAAPAYSGFAAHAAAVPPHPASGGGILRQELLPG